MEVVTELNSNAEGCQNFVIECLTVKQNQNLAVHQRSITASCVLLILFVQ